MKESEIKICDITRETRRKKGKEKKRNIKERGRKTNITNIGAKNKE